VLVNPYEVTVAYSTSDAEIAAVNETTGAVTIGEKEGTATITASFEGDETYKAATASYTITVKAVVGTDKYELVTDATTLKAGDEILIAYVDDEGATATVMGEQKSNNRAGVEATLNADMTITPTDAQVIKLEGETDAWYFNVGDGYLYAAGNDKNYLKTEVEADDNDNAKAKIAIAKNETTEAVEATIQFQGSNTRNLMRFNPNNGSPIFACYSSTSGTGSLPQLYRKVAESENKKGDVNNDGSVTIADVTTLVNIILGKNDNYNSEVADVNEDGSITIADVTTLVNIILGRAN
jgi:molybdopterin converting factor small subunit